MGIDNKNFDNSSNGTYSKWLEEKHDASCTITDFENKMNELTDQYNFDPDTMKCIAKYSEEIINKIWQEPKEVQENQRLVNVLNYETDNLIAGLKRQRVHSSTKVKLAIHNSESSANDDNFSQAA